MFYCYKEWYSHNNENERRKGMFEELSFDDTKTCKEVKDALKNADPSKKWHCFGIIGCC